MEVKDIIKEDRNKIVPSYEHRDYYREDGSYLYNSNREANWYKLGVLDCYDYFEQNRLKACDNLSDEEFEREADFVCKFVKEHHRQPTFSDAIEETRKQTTDKACKLLCDICKFKNCSHDCFGNEIKACTICKAEGGDYYRFTKLAEE